MRHDSRPPRPPGRLKRFAANAMLFFYGTQLLSGCVPAGSPSDEPGGAGEVARARAALDNVPFELRSDTILPTTSATPEAPGITPFTADVSPGGSANVSIPLWTPPGRAGIQPSLSIVYDSQGSDGLLGPGFNLAGLSQITLCPNSFARDGKLLAADTRHWMLSGGVQDYTRVYCLDGSRLVGSTWDRFTTEADPSTAITITGGNHLEALTFEVRGRDGLIRTYGRTTTVSGAQRDDALVRGFHSTPIRGANNTITSEDNQAVTLTWALASVRDRFGNRMDVHYDQAPATDASSVAWHRPSRITYTGFRREVVNPETGSTQVTVEEGQREVTFEYESRPDTFTGYLSGVKVGRDFRLSRINMKGPGLAPGASTLSKVALRSYKLKYYQGTVSQRSLLTELRECDGADVCKTPVRFDWEQGSWDFDYLPTVNVSNAKAGAGLSAFGLGAGRQGLAYFTGSVLMQERDLGPPEYVTDVTIQNWEDRMRLLQYPDAASTTLDSSEASGLVLWYPYLDADGGPFGGGDSNRFCGNRAERNLFPLVTDWDGSGRSSVVGLSCAWNVFPGSPYLTPAYAHQVSRTVNEIHWVGSELNPQYWLDVDGDRRNERVWVGRHQVDLEDTSNPNSQIVRRVVITQPVPSTMRPPMVPATRANTMSPALYAQSTRAGVRVADLDGTGKLSLVGLGSHPDASSFLDAVSFREVTSGSTTAGQLNIVPTTLRRPPGLPFFFPSLYAFTFDFIDVNGDGLQDAVTLGQLQATDTQLKLRVQFNTGKGFTEMRETELPESFKTALLGAKTEHGDFDGDGRVDLAVFRPGHPVQVLLAGPRGEFTQLLNLSIPSSGDSKDWSQVIDVNNDGLLDLTYRVGNELRIARRQKPVDELKRVHGNVQLATYQGYSGLSYSFEYAPLSQANPHGAVTPSEPFYLRNYTETTTTPWLRLAPESMRVVSRLSVNSNEQRIQSWRHLYRTGLSDTRGLGWKGFGQRIVIDEVTGARTTTTYDNVSAKEGTERKAIAPLAHLPVEELTEVPLDANTRLETKRQWTYARTVAQPYAATYQQYATRISETISERRGGAVTPVSEKETLTTLDAYGTPVSRTVLTHGALTTEQEQVVTTPDFDAATWLPRGTWTITTSWMSCDRLLPNSTGCAGQPAASNVRTMKVTHDAQGQVSSTENEPSLVSETSTATTSETYLKTTFARNAKGLVEQVSQQGANGVTRSETVTYDSVDQTQLSSTTDAQGHTWRYLFHPGLGVLAQTKDPNDAHVRLQYDGFGRQRIVTPLYQGPSAAPANRSVVETFYEWNGTLPQHRTRVATGNGVFDETVIRFDTMGRPVTTQSPRFDGQPVTTTLTYDVLGRVVKTELPRTSTEPPTWELHEYDALGRVTARRFADGSTGPNGRLLEGIAYSAPQPYSAQATSTDALGQVKKSLTDFRGLMVEATEAWGTAKAATMKYSYGPFGRLEHTDDPANIRSSRFYDAVGRLERTVDPNSGTRLFVYNAFGELKSHSDAPEGAAGRITTTYERDLLGRVLTATNPKESLQYWYDEGPGGKGRLTRASRTPVGTSVEAVDTAYLYDVYGRETGLSQKVAGTTRSLGREYDDYGRVGRLTYPAQLNGQPFSINYSYTDRGELSSVYRSNSITTYWRAYERDSMGRLKTAHYGNGVSRVFRYDTQGRLRFTEAKKHLTDVQRLAYEYTANDNLSARHDLMVGVTQKYTYDALDRLERWKVQQNCQTLDVQFQYDPVGNLLSRSPVSGWEPSASLQYTGGSSGGPHAVKQAQLGAESFTYEYDHRGNQLAMRDSQGALVRSVQYTPANLPENITSSSGTAPSSTVRFDYDASGTRVRKYADNGQDDETVYVGGLYQRRKQGSTVTHIVSIPSPEGVVAELSWQEGSTSESTRYFLNDPQGSPDTVTDASGAVLERIKYEPFGGRRQSTNLAQASATNHSGARRGFTGHEQDDELGLINMRGRIYDPRMMKFLSVDPVIAEPGSAQAYNAYSYVLNNPTRYTDPSGFTPYGGELVSSWGGGWTGAPQSHQSRIMGALERHLSMPGPSLYLPSVDFKVPSIQSLDDTRTQPDARHTNDIGQSSGSSRSGLTSLLTTASSTFNAVADKVPCGPMVGCHLSRAMTRSQLESMLNASTLYDRYAPVSKLAAASFAINEFIPFVSAGESYLETKSACSKGDAGGCAVGAGKTTFYTLASGASLLSLIESGAGVAGVLKAPVSSARSAMNQVTRSLRGRTLPPRGTFSMSKNAAGGEVWTSNGEIIQMDFAHLVDEARLKGNVQILSGTHGQANGRLLQDMRLHKEDRLRWRNAPNVTVHDINKLSPEEITNILRSEGSIFGAFCYSDRCLAPFR
ncbi:FG-GAP-like repeat-containing protein [Myxococcus sp. MISCRS1]|uniref:RHS repeat-associated core domain-containing protein n=1 Tax=Myxococcus sp. MISCRS1 TaxID=2996786 RepID=UPI00226EC4FA|nr:RHS repeat-associated core domain-containing protein [Myxococcus sp. MISCRS1]MCY1000864.1 FG-GAP-like repeat-containing protein [Myxococcus sp. MISCRS1]